MGLGNKTFLQTEIDTIRDETADGLNTAERVGKTLNDIVADVDTSLTAESDARIQKDSSLETSVNSATALASSAKDKADTATATAASAQTLASAADTKSDTAVSTAQAASSLASTASNTANSASSTASAAQSVANTAKGTADTALATATSAKNDAKTAYDKAAYALSCADADALDIADANDAIQALTMTVTDNTNNITSNSQAVERQQASVAIVPIDAIINEVEGDMLTGRPEFNNFVHAGICYVKSLSPAVLVCYVNDGTYPLGTNGEYYTRWNDMPDFPIWTQYAEEVEGVMKLRTDRIFRIGTKLYKSSDGFLIEQITELPERLTCDGLTVNGNIFANGDYYAESNSVFCQSATVYSNIRVREQDVFSGGSPYSVFGTSEITFYDPLTYGSSPATTIGYDSSLGSVSITKLDLVCDRDIKAERLDLRMHETNIPQIEITDSTISQRIVIDATGISAGIEGESVVRESIAFDHTDNSVYVTGDWHVPNIILGAGGKIYLTPDKSRWLSVGDDGQLSVGGN